MLFVAFLIAMLSVIILNIVVLSVLVVLLYWF